MHKEVLREVLRVLAAITPAPDKSVNRVAVDTVKALQGRTGFRSAFRRSGSNEPPLGGEKFGPPSGRRIYEIGWALDHAKKNRGLPLLYVYRNRLKPTPPLEPKEEREAFLMQWDSLQEF